MIVNVCGSSVSQHHSVRAEPLCNARVECITMSSLQPTYKDILTPDQQLVHEAALQACRERVAAKQARKKAGSERVPEIYKEFVSDDTQ